MKNIAILAGLPAEVVTHIESQDEEIDALKKQVEKLNALVRQYKDALFAPKSEKSKYILDTNQLALFNEAEIIAATEPDPPEPELITITYKRKPKRTKKELAETLPVREEVIDIPEDERCCNICEGDLRPIGREFVRRVLDFIPAQAYITETFRINYSCNDCIKETDEANIIKPAVPVAVVPRGLASPSSVAYAMYQKYVNAMPLYRQQEDWKNHGVNISRGTLANWIIYTSKHWLRPLWDAWREILLTAPVVLADETVIQVLKEPGKTPQSESRMWVYATGRAGPAPIVLFEYQPTRAGEHAIRFLSGAEHEFFLHTDGYPGYSKVPNVINCGCWAHCKRKFKEAMPNKAPADNPGLIGLRYGKKLFHIEKDFDKRKLSPQERHNERQIKSKPILDAFFAWVDSLDPLAGSKLATAVTYAKNQKEELMAFLLDGHIDISTNLIENKIRPVALGRKNWLFADSVAGAQASAIAYSVVGTAKANGLNPYDYLLFLFSKLPQILTKEENPDLSPFFPWTDGVAEQCKDFRVQLERALVE